MAKANPSPQTHPQLGACKTGGWNARSISGFGQTPQVVK
jgi:hypothetical protein